MTISTFAHLNLQLDRSQIDAVRDFYVEVLGLTEGYRPPFDSAGYWLYAGDAPIVHLVRSESGEPKRNGDTGVIDHLAFHCADLRAVRARLEAAGVPARTADVPETGQRQLFLHDPAGTRIELLFDEPGG